MRYKGKNVKRVLAALISVSMMVSLMPSTAFAADRTTVRKESGNQAAGDATVALGTEALSTDGYTNGWNFTEGKYVYYGKYDGKPTAWRLLKNESNLAFLDADEILWKDHLADSADDSNRDLVWQGSYMQDKLNGSFYYNNSAVFSDRERERILQTDHEADSYHVINDQGLDNPSNYDMEVIDDAASDYVFLMNCKELDSLYADPEQRIKHGVEFSFSGGVRPIYWTRTRMKWSNPITNIVTCWTGYYDWMPRSFDNWTGNPDDVCPFMGVSPAMRIDTSDVAFTTKSGVDHTKELFENSVEDSADKHYALTLKDGNDHFSAERTTYDWITSSRGGSFHLDIANVSQSANQISAMVLDSDQNILYYGKLADKDLESIDVKIPKGMAVGQYTLKVFSEQANDENVTSYASNMVDIPFEVIEHEDQWNYASGNGNDANKIYAWCSNEAAKCQYYAKDVRDAKIYLSVEASDEAYTDNTYSSAEITDDICEVTETQKVTSDDLVYYLDENLTTKTTPENSGADIEGKAPKFAGEYWVSVTVNGKTAKASFEITKGKQSASITMTDYRYGETPANPAINGQKESPEVTYYYYGEDETPADKKEWKNIGKDTLETGRYYMFAELSATQNYAVSTTEVVSFQVTGQDMNTDIKAENVEVTYDGNAHGIEVTGSFPEGYRIRYGTEEGKYTDETSPSYTDVIYQDGEVASYIIYYEVIAKGYTSKQGHATVKINPLAAVLTWSAEPLVYNGREQAPQAQVANLVARDLISGNECTVTVEGAHKDVNTTEKYIAKAVGLSNQNYKLSEPLPTTEYTIEPKSIADAKITLDSNAKRYTGNDISTDITKVMVDENVLEAEKDYVIDADSAVTARESGTYLITINGKGNYKDSAAVKWYITGEDGHIWPDEWTVVKEATASEEGRREMTCLVEGCGSKRIEIIPKVGSEEEKNGNLHKYTEVEEKAPIQEANVDNTKKELLASDGIFTAEEKERIEVDVTAKIWLHIAETDMDSLTEDDKTKIQSEADKIVGKDAELTYFDAELYKQLENQAKQKISEPGMKIKVSIQIPDDLLNHDSTMIREYKIVRLHIDQTGEHKVDVLNGTFDEKTEMFTFETDRFSTYAIAYKDTKKKTPSYPVIIVSPTPSASGSPAPSTEPTVAPSTEPSGQPTVTPSTEPSGQPTVAPSTEPSGQPTVTPSAKPSAQPTTKPSGKDQSKLTADQVAKLKLPILLASGKGGNHQITISWLKYNGATGYDCYWSYCDGKKNFKKFVTVTNGKRSVTQKNRKNSRRYKYFVAAYKMVNGKKIYIAKSNQLHVAMKGNNCTNAVSVSVNKAKLNLKSGQTFTLKCKTKLENSKKKQLLHAKAYRYYSSDKKVAVVSKSGKITAKGTGKCTIYVLANNGVSKKIVVKVK